MEKTTKSKFSKHLLPPIFSAANLLITIIFYSMKTKGLNFTLWNIGRVNFGHYIVPGFGVYLTLAFFVSVALYALGGAMYFVKKKKWGMFLSTGYNLTLNIILLIVESASGGFMTAGAVVFVFIGIFVSAAELISLAVFKLPAKEGDPTTATQSGLPEQPDENPPVHARAYKIILLACECAATVLLALTFFLPLYSVYGKPYTLIGTLTNSEYPLTMYIVFIAMFVEFFSTLTKLAATVGTFFTSNKTFAAKSQQYMLNTAVYALMFCIVSFGFSFYFKVSATSGVTTSASGFICFVLALALLVVHSVFFGLLREKKDIIDKKSLRLKAEPLIYVFILTVITFLSLVFNIVDVKFEVANVQVQNVALSGYDLLSTYGELADGFQIIAFLLYTFLLVSGIMLVLCMASFFTKSRDFYKLVKTSAILNTVFVALIGLFGVYFDIAQKVNVENIQSLLQMFGYNVDMNYTVSGSTIYILAVDLIVIVVMFVRKQFSLAPDPSFELTLPEDESLAGGGGGSGIGGGAGSDPSDFDACPAFTELDERIPQFQQDLAVRRQQLFEGLTLPNLVRFVVDYARDSRLHLSYTVEDIATFVAGLGASRLTILQGMSGTGKTSLPKIFTEALLGTCEIVEVESSWRDKNELLGYYNEFSRCFTPKKFTQCLYKARLNSEIPTFIVLDEMNLSRIEYYFSDFLSLMENEEHKREIKLLNVKLFRKEKKQNIEYKGLTDGHTVKIPKNVWFIGTANRDESTFEISDKVYDRAQTMNFNKRAPKIRSFGEPMQQRFVAYDMLTALFEQAKISGQFEAEENVTIQKAEKLLAPYNISFGNRILNQMETFVKIYCACFGDKSNAVNEAVEKILFSKVVAKLETKVVENKEALAVEFDKLGLPTCSAFIRKLNED